MKILQAVGAENPLVKLEKKATSEDYEYRQVGFCAQWALDNVCKFDNMRNFAKRNSGKLFLATKIVMIF